MLYGTRTMQVPPKIGERQPLLSQPLVDQRPSGLTSISNGHDTVDPETEGMTPQVGSSLDFRLFFSLLLDSIPGEQSSKNSKKQKKKIHSTIHSHFVIHIAEFYPDSVDS